MPDDRKNRVAQQIANSVMVTVYLLFLVWAILWKCRVPFIGGTERVINLIPFNGNTGYEKFFYFIMFVPLGFYVAAIANRRNVIRQIVTILSVALCLRFCSMPWQLAAATQQT